MESFTEGTGAGSSREYTDSQSRDRIDYDELIVQLVTTHLAARKVFGPVHVKYSLVPKSYLMPKSSTFNIASMRTP